jgi:hypothetical protein
MNFVRIDNELHPHFSDAWRIYEEAFPKKERRDLDAQKALFLSREYHFLVIRDVEEIVAFLAYWDFQDFVFIEHFAVTPKKR